MPLFLHAAASRWLLLATGLTLAASVLGATRHSVISRFPSYEVSVACGCSGFTRCKLSRDKPDSPRLIDQNPREHGGFYWDMIRTSLQSGAKMRCVAMFDGSTRAPQFQASLAAARFCGPAELLGYELRPVQMIQTTVKNWMMPRSTRLVK